MPEPKANFFEAQAQRAALPRFTDTVDQLLAAIHDEERGIGRSHLIRAALKHWIKHEETTAEILHRDKPYRPTTREWRLVKRVYKKHVRPFLATGSAEEREFVARSAPWLFRPDQIMEDGLRTGCASTAPVFAVLARMAGLHARLVISLLAEDFAAACPVPGEPRTDRGMDGHHVVMLWREDRGWSILDTSERERSWATDLKGRRLDFAKPQQATDTWMKFPGVSHGKPYVVRGVESAGHDLLLVRNFTTAANVKASGRHDSNIVRALPPRPVPSASSRQPAYA